MPGVKYGSIPIPLIQRWRGAIALLLKPNEYFQEAYDKYKGSLFRMSTPDKEWIVVADKDKILEYLAAPDDVVSSLTAANDVSLYANRVAQFLSRPVAGLKPG